MALKLDDNLLVELGLGSLPAEEKKAFLAHIYEKLELNVGVRLAEQMSEQQLMEFEQLINSGDEAGAFHWLETTFPGYKEVVAEEFDKLKNEIRPLAPQILAASQQALAGSVPAPEAQQQYQPVRPQPMQQPQSMPVEPQYGQQPYYGPPAAPQAPDQGQQPPTMPTQQ